MAHGPLLAFCCDKWVGRREPRFGPRCFLALMKRSLENAALLQDFCVAVSFFSPRGNSIVNCPLKMPRKQSSSAHISIPAFSALRKHENGQRLEFYLAFCLYLDAKSPFCVCIEYEGKNLGAKEKYRTQSGPYLRFMAGKESLNK